MASRCIEIEIKTIKLYKLAYVVSIFSCIIILYRISDHQHRQVLEQYSLSRLVSHREHK